MGNNDEAKARKLDQRHRDLLALAGDEGTTDAEASTARSQARRVAKRMRDLGWEPDSLPPLVDDSTSIPGVDFKVREPTSGEATIEVHGHRARPYKIAAPFYCPTCGHGRLTPYCPLCKSPAVETPRGVLTDGPEGWIN